MYVDFKAGNKEYRLRLNTRALVNLEKQLGANPVAIFANVSESNLPTITQMAQILYASLQAYEHGITLDKAYDIFDDYVADGHNPFEFIQVIVDVFQVSGLIPKVDEEKN
jgi:hypothetical protein